MKQAHLRFFDQTSHEQRRVLASTASGFTLENMDIMFLSFALTPIIAELHLSSGAAGLIGSITNIGMLVGGALFGLLGDKIGRVKTFSHTIFIFALATGLMAFANNLTEIYALRFLAGIGAGGEYGVGIALIAENFHHDQIGRMTSVAAIGGQVGAIIAALAAAWIIPSFGWHVLFLIGVLPVLLTFFVRRHLKESAEFLAARREVKAKHERVAFSELFKTRHLAGQTLGLMVMTIVQIAGYFGLMNWLPVIVQKQQGLSVSGSALWMIATILGMCLGMVVFGSLLDAAGPRVAFGLFLLASAGIVYAITLAQSNASLLLIGACVGFCSNGMFGGYGAVISRLYPTRIRSTANNVIMNVGRAIGGFSSVVIGLLMDHYNLTVTMAFLSVLYLISFITMLTLPGLRSLHGNLAEAKLSQAK
ncbi:MFS transporter [Lacticaseibacillus nasuensis]|uniref:Permease of the major facilitator superfamily protein n=1 Tax=Lacticaseibacillus nasuensis JCM 17158 TaxID=1291734 RepID=A0A0R1JKD8_9LACO|nr:MFS transporter [Lacticaseibacillus nasuensis]KRK71775.1 permease of the major facilitator superfamily protein [Lacticaseibacillus nasuensis JCM 17158]